MERSHKTLRFAPWVLFTVLSCMALKAQNPVVYRVEGDFKFDSFGWSIAVLNDIDGDGVSDFVASARDGKYSAEDAGFGYVRLISGRTGQVIRTWYGLDAAFGHALAAVGDRNGDGKVDFACAMYPNKVFIFSPLNEHGWLELFLVEPTSYIDFELATADVDGDAILDLIVGDAGYTVYQPPQNYILNLGRVLAYSGAGWKKLWEVTGTVEQAELGVALATIGDVDGDGLPDIAAGEPFGKDSIVGLERGRVRILRGLDGRSLRMLDQDPGAFMGRNLANVGDIDGDGFSDLAVSSPGYQTDRGRDQGWVGIYSGRTFEVIHEFVGLEGKLSSDFRGDQLGYRLGSAGDVDLDGYPDLLIGAYRVGPVIGREAGRLDLRSGKTGRLLASYEQFQEDEYWLGGVSSFTDIDGDGRPEFLIGMPHYPYGILTHPETIDKGQVAAIRYEPNEPRFIRGDANGDGQVDISDAVVTLEKVYFDTYSGDCLRAVDADGDERFGPNDPFLLLRYLFVGAYAPAPPFPECATFGGLRQSPIDCHRSSSCPP